ncbi:AGZA family xanthine/uracil permease-like MFS transporter [Alkalihalobacillus xiaoxiensis]|uniref:AGZA family xanthine/uracil permease-like MFS transporter n=1 Tax=Shouchella xiaoxiensis TaxID=766895 RepID=A0ABS2ST26_9BACI|nr:AGZA family xanthine/uracil permease-like MFS transporter [Shouchella xiaoxiensis]
MNLERVFSLKAHQTTIKQEVSAGTIAFLTSVYIVAINSTILADAGVPIAGAALATIITCFLGCLLMGFWSNAPILLIPGMGINAMFTYTFVQGSGLMWQEALAVVFTAGVLFMVIAFTPIAASLTKAIPDTLKAGITAGIGLFLTFIGLQKGGLIESNSDTFVQLANLTEPMPLATLLTLLVAVVLFVKQIPGHFLWTIIIGFIIGVVLNVTTAASAITFSLGDATAVIGQLSFSAILTIPFWTSVFALTMVLTFENIGLISGYTKTLNQPEKATRALQANAVSAMSAGFFGTSPTVSTAETAAGIAAGGRTGLTTVTTGLLFGLTIIALPFLGAIPDSAIAPILLIVGGLMFKEVAQLSFDSFAGWFSAYMIIAGIPLSYSIADGIAAGFVAYPILMLAMGKAKDVSKTMYAIGGLFFVHLLFVLF